MGTLNFNSIFFTFSNFLPCPFFRNSHDSKFFHPIMFILLSLILAAMTTPAEAITELSGHLLKNDDANSPSFIRILEKQVAAKQTEETELAEAEDLVKSFFEQKKSRRSGVATQMELLEGSGKAFMMEFQKYSRSKAEPGHFELHECNSEYFVRYMYMTKEAQKPIFSKKDYQIFDRKDYLKLYLKAAGY